MGSLVQLYFGVAVLYLVVLFSSTAAKNNFPCAARATNVSVVCVCNATYCDQTLREAPASNMYNVYTSSNAGLRFDIKSHQFKASAESYSGCGTTLDLDLSTTYQTIEGFGGAASDSAAITWSSIKDKKLRDYFMQSYFSESGIEYNMIRVPIGVTDFSDRYYSYQETPEGETSLSNFSLAFEDYNYKIPMVKEAMKVATDTVHILGSAWGSPVWMKTERIINGTAMIKEEYYHAFAEYHYKFIEEYAKEGIDTWGITTVNEPLSGIMSLGENVRVTWTVKGLGKWIAEHIGPMIRKSQFKDVKIITGDDQRMLVALWFNMVVRQTPAALDYIDGVGVHYYFDTFTPPDMLTVPLINNPDKFVLYTESSIGGNVFPHTYIGSWERAQMFARNIMEDLNYNAIGWIYWNLCLNSQGGPSIYGRQADSPIIVSASKTEFIKQPMFYTIGHFAKFLPRGSQRVAKVEQPSCDGQKVGNVAFVTPRDTLVTVLQNDNKEKHTVVINAGGKTATVSLPAESMATVEFLLE